MKPRSDYTASSTTTRSSRASRARPTPGATFGFAYYQNNKQGLKDIKVAEKGTTGISPNTETITSGEYPLSRPLFIYVKEDSLKKPEVGQYVKFYLEQTPQLIADIGYVAAPPDDYAQGLSKLQPFLATS
jgi:phosphate transport system substrate-binding protein